MLGEAEACSAGIQRWVDKSLLQWPIATAGAGAVDVVVQSVVRPPNCCDGLGANDR